MKKELFDEEKSFIKDPNNGIMLNEAAVQFRTNLINALLNAQLLMDDAYDLEEIEEQENAEFDESDYDLFDEFDDEFDDN